MPSPPRNPYTRTIMRCITLHRRGTVVTRNEQTTILFNVAEKPLKASIHDSSEIRNDDRKRTAQCVMARCGLST